MKTLFSIVFCLVLAGGALAQGAGYGGTVGVYFSEDQFDQSTAQIQVAANEPFRAYIVMTDIQFDNLRAFECMSAPMSDQILTLEVGGPEGAIFFGTGTDYIVGYQEPLMPDAGGGAVLCWTDYMATSTEQVDIVVGAATLESIPDWGGPAVVFDHDHDLIYHCDLSSSAHGYTDVVAVVNPAPVATETHTLSGVKALFE